MKKYLLLLLLPILSYASIGKITVLKGDVTINRDGSSIKAKSGSVIEKHDLIKTNKKGKVQIVFSDKTIFTIGKNSTLDISEYLYDESQPKQNKAKFNVLKGAFSSITGRIGKLNKSKFKLKTKSASIGIRGTIVKADQENIMCTDGAITVTTNNGIIMDVEAGQKTNVSSGVPTPPQEIEAGDEESMGADITAQDKEESEAIAQQEEQSDNTVQDIVASVQNEVNDIAPETRDIQLKGRTISSDGSQQYVTIDVNGLENELSIDADTGMKMTDNAGNVISSSANENVVWGHWADDSTKKWVAGQETSVAVIDNMRNETNIVNASYSGKVMGSVNGNDAIKMDATNAVNVNFALGGGQNSVDGTIGFETQSGQNWNTTFNDGTTSGNKFSSTTVGGDATTGRVDGSFYGDNAEAIGGTFDMTNGDSDKATGVFKADKQ